MINRQNKKLVDEYLQHRTRYDSLDPKSIRLERSLSMHYLTWADLQPFKNAPKFDVTLKEYVRAHRDSTGKPLSQNYQRKIIGSAKLFFTWLTIHKQGFRSITPAWLSTLKIRIVDGEFDDAKTILLDEVLQIARTPVNNLVEERVRAGAVFLYLSGMRIDAFISMPLKAVNFDSLEVKQTPALGIRTKNKKSATTFILELQELFDVVKAWDVKVRSILLPEGFWFAPISPQTSELDLEVTEVGEHRSSRFRKDLSDWLSKHNLAYHAPHNFRRGHANFLFDNAEDINDLEAARDNLMQESLTTTERYARQRRDQRKSRILKMSRQTTAAPETNISAEILAQMKTMNLQIKQMQSKMHEVVRS